jgi:hypothetical protein
MSTAGRIWYNTIAKGLRQKNHYKICTLPMRIGFFSEAPFETSDGKTGWILEHSVWIMQSQTGCNCS